jgi:hypothetical protein
MTGTLQPYRNLLEQWMPGVRMTPAHTPAPFDAIVKWRGPAGVVTYILQAKRQVATQDARVLAERFRTNVRQRAKTLKGARLLLAAPYVRPQQAAVLQHADIDFVDLAGNADLRARGLHVHVEGRKPAREHKDVRLGPTKGWVKTVLALLVRPDLVQAPLRTLAREADVARGTAAECLRDLQARGFITGAGRQRRVVDRTPLVATWVQAYGNRLRPGLTQRWLQIQAPRKEEIWQRLAKGLNDHKVPWALTGADAAERTTHYLRTDYTEIYAAVDLVDNREVLKHLGAQPGATRGNVLVIAPPGPLALQAAAIEDTIPVAPPLLVYAELRYHGDEQALEAAEMLLPHLIEP